MMRVTQRIEPVRLFWRRLFLLLLLFVAVLMLLAVWSVYGKWAQSASARAEAENKLRDVSARKDDMALALDDIESNRGKEAILRENYDVGRDGEGMIIIVRDTKQSAPSETKKTWIQKLISLW